MAVLKIKMLRDDVQPPEFKTPGAAAMDIYMPDDIGLTCRGLSVGLGFATEIPEGYCALIIPRSGAGCNQGVSLRNTVGVVDSDFRGEWRAMVRVDNEQHEELVFAGERLLQALFIKCESLPIEIVDELNDTERGSGGFGSTGK